MLSLVGKKDDLCASSVDCPGNFRPAFAIRSQFNGAVQNGDARRPYVGRDVGNTNSFASLGPCLSQRSTEALPADAGKLDGRMLVGLAEDGPRTSHDGFAVEFGHSSAVHRNGAFRGHGIAFCLAI